MVVGPPIFWDKTNLKRWFMQGWKCERVVEGGRDGRSEKEGGRREEAETEAINWGVLLQSASAGFSDQTCRRPVTRSWNLPFSNLLCAQGLLKIFSFFLSFMRRIYVSKIWCLRGVTIVSFCARVVTLKLLFLSFYWNYQHRIKCFLIFFPTLLPLPCR